MLSWEKPLVKPMAPGSVSYHICFQCTFIFIFTFCIYITKYQKYIYLIILSLLDLTFASNRQGIDNPFITLGASCLLVCAGIRWLVRCLLLDWYLGSQTKGNTYISFAASPFPLQGKKPTQAQEVAGRIYGAIAGEIYDKSRHTKNIYFIVYLCLSDLTFASNREGIDNPFIALGASCLIVCASIRWFVRCLLLDWYLGSQTKGNTYSTLLHDPFLFKGKTNASSRSSTRLPVCLRGRLLTCVPSTHAR